jgi:hypothetical protein
MFLKYIIKIFHVRRGMDVVARGTGSRIAATMTIPSIDYWRHFLALGLIILMLTGCAGQDIQRRQGASPARPFSVAGLAKSDVDQMAELTQREVLISLERLAVKLYKRNPGEYRKSGASDPELAGKRLFEDLHRWPEVAISRPDWLAGFRAAFDEAYAEDRVRAFIGALLTMTMSAYNDKTEFFITDSLDAQRLYNSARNIEVAAWKLANAKSTDGRKILLSNSMEGEVQNLSFEREIGKLIGHQDLLALIIEERTQRTVTRVLQNVATFAFIPL